jgi:TRAP-type uncharacterized transport system fused permease subunit
MKFALAASVQGWLLKRADALQRVLLLIAALALIKPGWRTDLLGLGLAILVLVIQYMSLRRTAGMAH